MANAPLHRLLKLRRASPSASLDKNGYEILMFRSCQKMPGIFPFSKFTENKDNNQ
jgi:hypothetical protein